MSTPFNVSRRLTCVAGLLSISALASFSGSSGAAPYPEKVVKTVIGYGPGSSADLVAKSSADGYTMLFAQNTWRASFLK